MWEHQTQSSVTAAMSAPMLYQVKILMASDQNLSALPEHELRR
jgi:hypothetical protein